MAEKYKYTPDGKGGGTITPEPDDGGIFDFFELIAWLIAGIVAIFSNKTARRVVLSMFAVFLLAGALYALIAPAVDPSYTNPLEYTLSDNGEYYVVSGILDSSITNVEIPTTIDGKPIKYISDSAFKDCKKITSVTIPQTITTIEDSTFEGCKSLTSVVIPNSVTIIGDDAFSGCSSLTNIVIPDSVTSIGDSAFYGCVSLASVTLPDGITIINKGTFRSCTSLTKITIPNSITGISESAFAFCDSLTSVTIPQSVNNIGENAFEYCESLTTIHYRGTMDQWDAIEKVEGQYSSIDGILDWNYSTGSYTIYCTNGNISK